MSDPSPSPVPAASSVSPPVLGRALARRLRDYYRSAGWPCCDELELDLLARGLIEILGDGAGGGDRIRLTPSGIVALGAVRDRNRCAFDAHEALVERVAREQTLAGRLVYRGLMLRGRIESGWKPCRPDVYSIRYTSVAAYTAPMIHEIKVRRADLLADLQRPDKRATYQALCSEFYYVMPSDLAALEEIPADCGVLFADAGANGLRLGRAAPRRSVEPGFATWMALARRGAEPVELDEVQAWLGAPVP